MGAQQALAASRAGSGSVCTILFMLITAPAGRSSSNAACKVILQLAMRQKSGRLSFLVYDGTRPHLTCGKQRSQGGRQAIRSAASTAGVSERQLPV